LETCRLNDSIKFDHSYALEKRRFKINFKKVITQVIYRNNFSTIKDILTLQNKKWPS